MFKMSCVLECALCGGRVVFRISVCVCVCVCLLACSLTNPACNAPPYCHLRPLWLHYIFFIIISQTEWFSKKKKKAAAFIRNISHSKKNSARYGHKCEKVFMWSICYSCPIFNDPRIFITYFQEKLKYQMISKSVQWEPSCCSADGRTWRS
jgi:hypothetical protein